VFVAVFVISVMTTHRSAPTTLLHREPSTSSHHQPSTSTHEPSTSTHEPSTSSHREPSTSTHREPSTTRADDIRDNAKIGAPRVGIVIVVNKSRFSNDVAQLLAKWNCYGLRVRSVCKILV
jgi:hypothetical protein